MHYSRLWMLWAYFFNPKRFEKLSQDYTQFIIGGIALAWATAEAAIDGIVFTAYHNGGHHFSASLPRALNRKIQYLKIVFKKLPKFQEFAADGLQLLERMEALANDRHWAIHGTILGHLGNVDLEIKVQKLRWYEHHFEFEQKMVSVSDLLNVWEKSNKLSIELLNFSRPILTKFLKDSPDDSAGG